MQTQAERDCLSVPFSRYSHSSSELKWFFCGTLAVWLLRIGLFQLDQDVLSSPQTWKCHTEKRPAPRNLRWYIYTTQACLECQLIQLSSKVFWLFLLKLEFDLTSIGLSAVFALGGIWILFSSFDDDDDEDGGGTGSPVHVPIYVGNHA